MTEQKNTFKIIPGFSNYYASGRGEIYSTLSNKVLKNLLDRDGYHYVIIRNDDGVKKMLRVHRAVMAAWRGPSSQEVLHLDHDKTNNSLSNLRYGTHAENMASGLKPYRYLGYDELKEMHALYHLYNGRGKGSIAALAKRFDISATAARKHLRPVTAQREARRLEILKTLRRDFK